MKLPIRMKRIGYVGITDGKPFFEDTTDDYVLGGRSIPIVDVYRSKKEARKRFREIRPVYIPTLSK